MYSIQAIKAIDSYKLGHCTMYPEGTTKVYANFTARSFKYIRDMFPEGDKFFKNKAVVYGISAAFQEIVECFKETFFSQDRDKVLEDFRNTIIPFIGDNSPDIIVNKMKALHDLGYLPIRVKSLPEGVMVKENVPMMTITNTHPDFAWLPTYLETFISSQIWKLSTSATIAKSYKNIFDYFADLTGTPRDFVLFQGHDFSPRGMSGFNDVARSGTGHLTSFMGTDNVCAIEYAKTYYNAEGFIGGSVPASEHSVMTMGLAEGEIDTFRRIFKQYPKGVVSIVSDSYDYWDTITNKARVLKPEIMAREKDSIGLCKTVFRPDCYTEGTYVLTDVGFKLFSDLTLLDNVAQVKDDLTFEYVKPTEVIKYQYEGDVHTFISNGSKKDKVLDITVTPDHRMMKFKDGKLITVFAKDLPLGSRKQKFGNILTSPKISNSDNKKLTDKEKFLIALQADGTIRGDYVCEFNLKKQRKIDRLTKLIDNLKLEYKIYDYPSRKDQKTFRVHTDFKLDYDDMKRSFSWVDTANISSTWSNEFIDELVQWDGTIRSSKRYKFDTTDKKVMDTVEIIALSAGLKTKRNTFTHKNKKASLLHTIAIVKNNKITYQGIQHKIENYSGYVYCCKVPTGRLIVKRNNTTPIVCGNSGNPVDVIVGTVKNREITASSFEEFKEIVVDILHEELVEITPHGEYGGSIYNYFKFNDKYYEVAYDPDWNRYNKQYYFIDNCGSKVSKLTVKEIELTPEQKGSVECLYEIFGGTKTDKGYIQLDEHVGLIYGDSITPKRAYDMCKGLAEKGFASGNIVCGIGSFTYNYMTRDSLGFAMKATYAEINGESVQIFKQPKTDSGKNSARGMLRVDLVDGEYVLVDGLYCDAGGELRVILDDGVFQNLPTLQEIRDRLANA